MVIEIVSKIIKEIDAMQAKLNSENLDNIAQLIASSPSVFIAGAGRAGAIMQCFAKRLMHIGLDSYVIGESTTPPAKKGNLLIVGSGSGETESLVIIANKAIDLGIRVLLITTNPDSSIGKVADYILEIPAITPKSAANASMSSIQPMANLFEQMLLICTDAISVKISYIKEMDYDQMFARHANLE